MSRTLPKKNNPLILADTAPPCKLHLETRTARARGRATAHATAASNFPLQPPTKPSLTWGLRFAITDDELLARRRLGKTNLSVKENQIGTSNATKRENLGLFEYAHLRAPLPKDLKGSEIFPSHSAQQHPETYFLMVRIEPGA